MGACHRLTRSIEVFVYRKIELVPRQDIREFERHHRFRAILRNGFTLPPPPVGIIPAPLPAWHATRMNLQSAAWKEVCICATGRQGFSSPNAPGRAVTPNILWPWATRS
jgi:hypothetical protein